VCNGSPIGDRRIDVRRPWPRPVVEHSTHPMLRDMGDSIGGPDNYIRIVHRISQDHHRA